MIATSDLRGLARLAHEHIVDGLTELGHDDGKDGAAAAMCRALAAITALEGELDAADAESEPEVAS